MSLRIDASDLTNPPDATRLIYGLRDTGYNFNTAAADIIDNSIAASATEINVQIELLENGRKFVYFGDNGNGMDAKQLFNAMRYGADARGNPKSLGKFGLGLKTASSSVCLCFTVISRKTPSEPLNKLSWDLEFVEKTDRWEMVGGDVSPGELEIFEELCGEKGTLVIWSKCDRLLSKDYHDPGGAREKAAIKRLANRLIDHVSLIYYRFLITGDERERNISLNVNGEPVTGWNPFYPERAEQVLATPQQTLEIELLDGSIETAAIRAWILPHSRDMSAEEKKQARISNRGQGFYIHREGRVIQQGGWLSVFGAMEPHTSLLRIEFDFGYELDDAFKVDVKKSKILLDPALEDGLRRMLQPIYREAGNRYRRIGRAAAAEKGIDHVSANKSISNTPSTKKPVVVSADVSSNSAVVSNNRGATIKLKIPVQNSVNHENIYVEAVDDIRTGDLWEPALRSETDSGHVVGVRINKHHDFYQKVYQRQAYNGYAVEGMDLLLWAFAAAEQNNMSPDLEPIFEDLREEVSGNLRKLLRDLEVPTEGEFNEDADDRQPE